MTETCTISKKQGISGNIMTPVRKNIFKFFREYQPEKELTNKDGLEYFVSGESQDNIVNGGGLLYRDAITMDFDELPPAMNVKEFEKLITSKLPNISYIIHASWSYSDENQIRKIHLIIPTKQRILTASHYYNCHLYLEQKVGEIADKNLRSWGHLLSLPAYHNKENMVIFESGELFDASIVPEVCFNENEQIEHTINQRFRRIPENESDPIVAAFIAHYRETKLLEDNFYLGRIYTLGMHVCKGNMEEETAIRYARALGIGRKTSDNKSWADENERALMNKISNGRRNSNYFNETQDFWTNFAIRGVNDKADGLEEISRRSEINWRSSLKKNSKEPYNVMKTMNNLKRILENDPSLNEVLLYNEFTGMIEKGATPPWENRFNRQWSDDDVAGLRLYLSENYDIEFGRENLFDVILSVAKDNSYHPVKSLIESVKWDGTPRAETIFIDYLGADDNEYIRAVAKKWLTGAVARIYEPGIKFEIVPMLTGKQGRGKSTLAAKLGGEHFNDDLKDMKSKDSKDFLQGSWIIELGELAAMRRTEVEEVKSFISAKMDRYRPSYGRITLDHPRTCVFMGTTNDLQFLKDVSGNRRFYPIPIDENERTADVFSIEAATVQQIWAESLINYQNGEKIYMPERLEKIANEYRGNATETNPMQDDIYRYLDFLLPEEWEIQSLAYKRSYIDGKLNNCDFNSEGKVQRNKVTTREILTELFCRDSKEELRGQSEAKKVGLIMNNHDEWKSTSYYVNTQKVRGYVRRSSLTE